MAELVDATVEIVDADRARVTFAHPPGAGQYRVVVLGFGAETGVPPSPPPPPAELVGLRHLPPGIGHLSGVDPATGGVQWTHNTQYWREGYDWQHLANRLVVCGPITGGAPPVTVYDMTPLPTFVRHHWLSVTASRVLVNRDGDYFVGMQGVGSAVAVYRFAADGTQLWALPTDNPGGNNDDVAGLDYDERGGWVYTAEGRMYNATRTIRKINAETGAEIWAITTPPAASGVVVTADQSIIVGFSASSASPRRILHKYDSDGNFQWEVPLQGTTWGTVTQLRAGPNGEAYFCMSGGTPTLTDERIGYIGRVNADGSIPWLYNPGVIGFGRIVQGLSLDQQGNVLACEATLRDPPEPTLWRLTADGGLVWAINADRFMRLENEHHRLGTLPAEWGV